MRGKPPSHHQLLYSPEIEFIFLSDFVPKTFSQDQKLKNGQNKIWGEKKPHLGTLVLFVRELVCLLALVFGGRGEAAAAAVQVLHQPEEGQLVEEDLRDLHQEVFAAVLQGSAHKFAEGLLWRAGGTGRVGV